MYQRVGPSAYKADLTNTMTISNYLGNPERKFKSIHVAGTNGKGSVSHMLASVFMEAGLKTGLYTSPHLLDFRERMSINGKMIPKNKVIFFVERNRKKIEEMQPSFFEITVLLAFDYFAKEKVDIAIIETGLGGRLDSTNIVTPLLSIITNISLEHQNFLGDTLEKIASEKAGIIKEKIPVVIGEKKESTKDVFISKAKNLKSELRFAEDYYSYKALGIKYDIAEFEIRDPDTQSSFHLTCDLTGSYQGENICTCLAAFDFLQKDLAISKESIRAGIAHVKKNTSLCGRWEILGKNPMLVCDISHNPVAIQYMLEQLNYHTYKKLHIVFGMSEDKSIDEVLSLMPAQATYYFAKPDVPRGMDADKLMQNALKYNLKGGSYLNVEAALKAAQCNATKDDFLLITGSAFVVADALSFLNTVS